MNAPSSDPSPDALRKIAEEALALAEKATPGLWTWDAGASELTRVGEILCRMQIDGRVHIGRATDAMAARDPKSDAAFIAHARTSLPALASAFLAASARVKELEAKASALEKAAAGVQIELDVHFGIDGWPSDLSNAVKRLAIDRDAMFSALTEGSR